MSFMVVAGVSGLGRALHRLGAPDWLLYVFVGGWLLFVIVRKLTRSFDE